MGVEPIQDVFGGDVVHDLMIQLLADVERQSGYLTSVRSHLISGSWFVVRGSWLMVENEGEKAEMLKAEIGRRAEIRLVLSPARLLRSAFGILRGS